ncbi:MAG: sulfate adenylyltransferase [Deltaproteobacteria bacterium]|nr:MAG: sulfate adenylyltransferase [Deltaproteobacteria bacterium]
MFARLHHDAPGPTPSRDIETFLRHYEGQELLRFVAVGSVDDGKSTLIGRLLHDTGSVYRDQIEAVRRASARRGVDAPLDYALFTDGLRAEREQGITIDVAYRYFFTARRKFIVADTPGHVQYTRNMVTGASTANVAVILIDARHGVLEQSRRHAAIASLLRTPHLVVCINKMDLVDFDPDVFGSIRTAFAEFARGLAFHDVTYIPVSALAGDNVIERSPRTPWYEGPTLLEFLETVPVLDHRNHRDFRFPIQTVIRPHLDYRGLAGTVASGAVRVGDEVVVLPSGRRTKVASIDTFDGALEMARTPQSITVRLADEIDASRGEMLVAPDRPPTVARTLDAHLVWMDDAPLEPGRAYLLKHTTATVRAKVTDVHGKTDLFSLGCVATDEVGPNDIVRVRIEAARPIFCDPYATNRATGAFILIDPVNHHTVAAGMVERAFPVDMAREAAPDGRTGATVLVRGPYDAAMDAAERGARHLRNAGLLAVAVVAPGSTSRALETPEGSAVEEIARAVREAGGVALVAIPDADACRVDADLVVDADRDADGRLRLRPGAPRSQDTPVVERVRAALRSATTFDPSRVPE